VPEPASPLLEVRGLDVSFRTENGVVHAVDGLSLSLGLGEVVGIVGESGSGKTVSMMAVMRLIRDPNAIVKGEVIHRGRDLLKLSQREMRAVRGGEIAMIFQDPMTALTPVYTVGWQIAEQLRAHEDLTRKQARRRTVELLAEVGISNPERRIDDYPHEFSGGMRQRVMIAMALSCNPSLLIADEPTTALDVTIQAQILELMKRLQRDYGSSILLITHDMGVVSEIAERVVVMYAGSVVEEGPKAAVFRDPQHPYTWGLLGSIPRVGRRVHRLAAIPGLPPSLLAPPEGCRFAPRCVHRFERCAVRPELLERVAPGRADACHLEPSRRAALRNAAANE
jgi:peptide/nickel transport system ATP-binding protein